MIDNFEKEYPDGRLFKYHKITSNTVDFSTNQIKVVIASWTDREDALKNNEGYVLFLAKIPFVTFNQEQLNTLEQDVISLEWVPYKSSFTQEISLTLEQVKEKKRKEINTARDLIEKQGFPYLDKIFETDIVSSIRLSISVQAASIALQQSFPFSVDWTTKDNSIITLDANQMIALPLAFASYSNSLHINSRDKKLLIDDATTIEEVEAITWD